MSKKKSSNVRGREIGTKEKIEEEKKSKEKGDERKLKETERQRTRDSGNECRYKIGGEGRERH